MAARPDLSLSMSSGNEEVISCSKCNSGEDAERFCFECRAHLCSKCISEHDKWNKEHTLVPSYDDIARYSKQTLTEFCHLHKEKLIDRFCPSHDAVFCPACRIIDHSSCATKSILHLSQGFKSSDEHREMMKTTQALLNDLKVAKAQEEKQWSEIDKQLSSDIQEIAYTRTKVKDHFDKLEADAKQSLSSMKKYALDANREKIGNLVTLITSIEKVTERLANNDDVCDAAMFVNVKKDKKMVTSTRTSLGALHKQSEPFFEIDNTVMRNVKLIHEFGHAVHTDHVYKATPYDKVEVRIKNKDDVDSDITGSFIMDDGSIFIVDRTNNKLKCLDSRYKIISWCTVPGMPYDVCHIDMSQSVAVTILGEKKIQFVSVKDRTAMKHAASFNVHEHCRGIAYKDGELFVSCGGSKGEGPGHIEVFDVCGTHLRDIGQEHLRIPIHIGFTVPTYGKSIMYVTDSLLGAVCRFDKYGCFLGKLSNDGLREAKGLCIANNQHVFATGKRSHSVLQFDKSLSDAKSMQYLLQNSDGIFRPCSLMFDQNTSRLIVTMSGNCIRIFTLH